MSARFVNVDRNTPLLFPVDFGNVLPKTIRYIFIIEAVEHLGMGGFKANDTGNGSEQYSLAMTLMSLPYCHAYRADI
ncbi:MAG: hypothetical protein LBH85_06840 [Treponema sp.]|nr:hypothetical protein [Treponema sp.]